MEAFLRNFSCTHLKSPLAGAEPCPTPGVDALLASLTEPAIVDLEGMAASYALHASGVLAPLWDAVDQVAATLRGFAGDAMAEGFNQTSSRPPPPCPT